MKVKSFLMTTGILLPITLSPVRSGDAYLAPGSEGTIAGKFHEASWWRGNSANVKHPYEKRGIGRRGSGVGNQSTRNLENNSSTASSVRSRSNRSSVMTTRYGTKRPVALSSKNRSILGNRPTHRAEVRPNKVRRGQQPVAIASRTTVASTRFQQAAPSTLLPIVSSPDIKPRHQELANMVLRSFPQSCVSKLKRFYVRYDNPEHRGLAGKSTIILDGSVPDSEFVALLVHEFGHVTDLGCLTGDSWRKASQFRDGDELINENDPSVSFYSISWMNAKTKKAGAREADFVSGYASWDPFEDFSESFAYFMFHRDAFEKRAKENQKIAMKLAWMKKHFTFWFDTSRVESKHVWKGKVPWDITKLGYSWNR